MKIKKQCIILILPLLALCIFASVVVLQQHGVQYKPHSNDAKRLPEMMRFQNKEIKINKENLLLINSEQTISQNAKEVMEPTLSSMSVATVIIDVQKQDVPDFSEYQTVIIAFSDVSILEEKMQSLLDWVKSGGKLMFMCTFEDSDVFQSIRETIGIPENFQFEYLPVKDFQINPIFMLNGDQRILTITDPFEGALDYQLSDDCTVLMSTTGENGNLPLIWSRNIGKGRIVVNNHSIMEKGTRGFFASAYSFLFDAFAYPVINASTYFIDDFPSPVPAGTNEFIQRDYQCSVQSFYSNIWLSDMMHLSQQYDIPFTGFIIENYTDRVKGPFERQLDVVNFQFFGNLLLQEGGELGYHGYDHIPLAVNEYDSQGKYPTYTPWHSMDSMIEAMNELRRFSQELFPDNDFRTYVPPSNILSSEGLDMLKNYFSEVDVISAVYLPGYAVLEQEFEVDNQGVVHFPRITSGYDVESFAQIACVSEMNLHLVNSHFIHPDDVLDVDRGAEKGWAALRNSYEDYIQWIEKTAPPIRNLTASQGAAAIERYDKITIEQREENNQLLLSISGFYDEAYFLLRWQKDAMGEVTGGEVEQITDNLYLIHATEENVAIGF